jgi:hypothetical protein
MRYLLAGALAVAGVAGCSRAGEKETIGAARDTVVTPRQTADTTIIKTDTTVTVDTTVKRGEGETHTDTVKVDSTRSQ